MHILIAIGLPLLAILVPNFAEGAIHICESGEDMTERIAADSIFIRTRNGVRSNCLYEIPRPNASTCGILFKFDNMDITNCTNENVQLYGYALGQVGGYGYSFCNAIPGSTWTFPFASSSNRMSLAMNITTGSYNINMTFLTNCHLPKPTESNVVPLYTCDGNNDVVRIPNIGVSGNKIMIASSLSAPTCTFIMERPGENLCGAVGLQWRQQMFGADGVSEACTADSSIMIDGAEGISKNELLCGRSLKNVRYHEELSIRTRVNPSESFVLELVSQTNSKSKCYPTPEEVQTCSGEDLALYLKGNATLGSSSAAPECTFLIMAIPGHSQIRVDFTELALDAPNRSCSTDSLIQFAGTVTVYYFSLCGDQIPEHSLYLTFVDRALEYQHPIEIRTKITPGNRFKFTIMYIENGAREEAPRQCLVMLPGHEPGIFKSFGFPKYALENTYKACVRGVINNYFSWSECTPENAGTSLAPFQLDRYFTNENGTVRLGATGDNCDNYRKTIRLHGGKVKCGARFPPSWTYVGLEIQKIHVDFSHREGPPLLDVILRQNECPGETIGFRSCTKIAAATHDNVCICPLKWTFPEPDPSPLPNTGFCLQYKESFAQQLDL